MMDLAAVGRTSYRPSGKVSMVRFLIAAVLVVVLGAATGALQMYLYVYAQLISPFLIPVPLFCAALALAWLVFRLTVWSKCRNPMLGAILGLACGLVSLTSEYQMMRTVLLSPRPADVVQEFSRLDRLPDYITSRFEKKENQTRAFMAVVELLVMTLLPTLWGRNGAKRVYSESLKQWSQRWFVRAAWGSEVAIIDALKARQDLASTLSKIRLCNTDPRPNEPSLIRFTSRKPGEIECAWMVLESVKNRGVLEAAYMTVTDINPRGKGRLVIRQLQLTGNEMQAALDLFAVS